MTPKELRAVATMLKIGEYDGVHIMHAWIALREYADLKEAAEKGVTDELVTQLFLAATRDNPNKTRFDAISEVLAPLLALKGDKP
jgi:hypothetical protein